MRGPEQADEVGRREAPPDARILRIVGLKNQLSIIDRIAQSVPEN